MSPNCPTTPNRSKSERNSGLQTPSTPDGKNHSSNLAANFKTPVTAVKRPVLLVGKPITPEFTPQRSIDDTPTTQKIINMTPSTITRTPKITSTPTTSAPVIYNATATFTTKPLTIRKRKIFTSEYLFKQSSMASTEDKLVFGPALPGTNSPAKAPRTRVINKAFEEEGSDEVDSLCSFHSYNSFEDPPIVQPSTPKSQMICDQLVSRWNGKTFQIQYSSDEESDIEIEDCKPTLVNPFLIDAMRAASKRTSTRNPFREEDEYSRSSIEASWRINYDTHMEYSNNKTGERRVVKLSGRQMKIKPKKLEFTI